MSRDTAAPTTGCRRNFTPSRHAAVDNLRGFLDACGWTCIYGLNFGTGSPERDAAEAAYVARALGDRLRYFQIGNEPDFYRAANNLLRPRGWDFPGLPRRMDGHRARRHRGRTERAFRRSGCRLVGRLGGAVRQ